MPGRGVENGQIPRDGIERDVGSLQQDSVVNAMDGCTKHRDDCGKNKLAACATRCTKCVGLTAIGEGIASAYYPEDWLAGCTNKLKSMCSKRGVSSQ